MYATPLALPTPYYIYKAVIIIYKAVILPELWPFQTGCKISPY